MREFFKVLPLGLALPVTLFAASIGPEDAASNLSKWVRWVGIDDLPLWLTEKTADRTIPEVVVVLCLLYAVLVWGLPWFSRRRRRAPISASSTTGAKGSSDPIYDTPMWKAVRHVAEKVHDLNAREFYPQARKIIRQAAIDGLLTVWGKHAIIGQRQDFSDAITEIPKEYWQKSEITAVGASESGIDINRANWSHTGPESASSWGPKGWDERKGYAGLRIDWTQLQKVWPIEPKQMSALRLLVGEGGKFFSTKGSSIYGVKRTFLLKIENVSSDRKLSGCKVTLLRISPQTEYEGPWLLKDSFDLAAGDHLFIPLASYGEARNPQISDHSDSFILILPESPGSPKPSKRVKHTLVIRATSLDSPVCDLTCGLWVDERGRLRIEESE
jgi:hypothetical protein